MSTKVNERTPTASGSTLVGLVVVEVAGVLVLVLTPVCKVLVVVTRCLLAVTEVASLLKKRKSPDGPVTSTATPPTSTKATTILVILILLRYFFRRWRRLTKSGDGPIWLSPAR